MYSNAAYHRDHLTEHCNHTVEDDLGWETFVSGIWPACCIASFIPFSLSVLLFFSLLLDSPFDASRHSSCTYYPCLFTHLTKSFPPQHYLPLHWRLFFGLLSVLHPALYLSCFFFYYLIFCPLSDRLSAHYTKVTHHYEGLRLVFKKHWLLVGFEYCYCYYYRRLLMKLWNNTPFCSFFFYLSPLLI